MIIIIAIFGSSGVKCIIGVKNDARASRGQSRDLKYWFGNQREKVYFMGK